MLRLVSDADVNGDIIRGLHRARPELDLVRAQDVGLTSRPDPDVLIWAAAQGRILITNDRNTMVGFAYQRVTRAEVMPGMIATSNEQSIGGAINDIVLIAECLPEDEMRDRVIFLPYRG
jgi:hypothetical protein